MPEGKYFDDFEVGERFVTPGRTITEADLVNYAAIVGMTDEIFVNRELARQGPFGQPIVPAPLTMGIANGLCGHLHLLSGTNIAVMGFQARAIAPLFIGDTVHVELEVSNKKRTSSRPDRGVVTFLYTVNNQQGRPVISFTMTFMMRRRPGLVEVAE